MPLLVLNQERQVKMISSSMGIWNYWIVFLLMMIDLLLVEFGVGLTVSNVMIALFNAFIGFKSGKAS